jgi:Family of unknown function (DUF6519)
MKGDYSGNTFDPRRHFSQVLMQQGRVLVDADFNESTSILLHYIRTLAADLIGRHGGPARHYGFGIKAGATGGKLTELGIGRGRYWVDGYLCENESPAKYMTQPHFSPDEKLEDLTMPLFVYLDVWERHITAVEDPRIREVALGDGGPDTCARAQVVWQVRVVEMGHIATFDCLDFEASQFWQDFLSKPAKRGRLSARADTPATGPATPCVLPPDSRFRGLENQLYRVEIHTGGDVGTATFKWSRENGSVVFPIESVASAVVTVSDLGRDARTGLEIGDWVEAVDDDVALDDRRPDREPLFQVEDIDTTEMVVTLSGPPNAGRDETKHPYLRRWDHQKGTPSKGGLTIVDGAAAVVENAWLNLENSVQIRFETGGEYLAGDYWLIPGRPAIGDVEWETREDGTLVFEPPRGVEHHYAPLAIIDGGFLVHDLRHVIDPVGACCPTVIVRRYSKKENADNMAFVAIVRGEGKAVAFNWTVSGATTTIARTEENFVVTGTVTVGPTKKFVTAAVEVEFEGGCRSSASFTSFK